MKDDLKPAITESEFLDQVLQFAALHRWRKTAVIAKEPK